MAGLSLTSPSSAKKRRNNDLTTSEEDLSSNTKAAKSEAFNGNVVKLFDEVEEDVCKS